MADTIEMQDIRGLDIDKTAKGFAEETYIFKNACTIVGMSGDSKRWYQKTAGTLGATAPSAIANVSPLSNPATLEPSWTRNTSYVRKYFVEGFLSMEDIQTADLDVLATTIRDLTLAVVKQVDAHIWDVMSESQSPSNIQTFATTAIGGDQWDAASSAGNPVLDLLHAKKLIYDQNYNPEGANLFLSPADYKSLFDWIYQKGAQATEFISTKLDSGVITRILGLNIKVSNNVTADYAMVQVPNRSTTYAQMSDTTARVIKEEGVGSKVRVWEHGVAYNTDPKCIILITDTQT